MADVNRGNRPLSPHLSIYNLPLTARMSIMHRITGMGLVASAVLVVWWFLAAATGPASFAWADWFLTSWLGDLVLLISLAALWYHFFNGLRHLVWDAGIGFGLDTVRRNNLIILVAAGVMTVITLIVGWV